MTVYELLHKAAVDGLTPDEVVELLLHETGGTKCPRCNWGFVTPVIVQAYLTIVRAQVRSVEEFVEHELANAKTPEDRCSAREKLNRETVITMCGGQRVAWGEMTVEQHRKRVAFLNGYKLGLERTIKMHLDAIAEIEAAGVRCLDEITSRATTLKTKPTSMASQGSKKKGRGTTVPSTSNKAASPSFAEVQP